MSKVSTIMIENTPVHDNLSTRLAYILFKLNQGEKIDPRQLAQEFSVDVRTIQRDLNVRLAALPIYKDNGFYQLEAAYLGRIDTHRLREFAQFAGIKGLFPRLDGQFVKHFIQQQDQLIMLVPQQHIIDESKDTLTLSTQIRHADQLLPIVQYWIPYVRIIEPKEMMDELVVQLQNYLLNTIGTH